MRFIVAILLIAACGEPVISSRGVPSTSETGTTGTTDTQPQPGTPTEDTQALSVVLKPGEEAQVPGEPLWIRFEQVLEDSRCPKDVTCVWEGNARVRISARTADGQAGTFDLNTAAPGGQRSAEFGDYVIVIGAVDPAPVNTTTIPPDEYRVRITVGRQ